MKMQIIIVHSPLRKALTTYKRDVVQREAKGSSTWLN